MIAAVDDGQIVGAAEQYVLQIYDNTSAKLADLPLYSPLFTFGYEDGVLQSGSLNTDFDPQDMVAIVTSIAGIQEEGVASLLKSVFGVPESEQLPARLTVTFAFEPTAL